MKSEGEGGCRVRHVHLETYVSNKKRNGSK